MKEIWFLPRLACTSGLQIDSQKNNKNMNPSHLKHVYTGVLVRMHLISCVRILSQIRVFLQICRKMKKMNQTTKEKHVMVQKQHIKTLKQHEKT